MPVRVTGARDLDPVRMNVFRCFGPCTLVFGRWLHFFVTELIVLEASTYEDLLDLMRCEFCSGCVEAWLIWSLARRFLWQVSKFIVSAYYYIGSGIIQYVVIIREQMEFVGCVWEYSFSKVFQEYCGFQK